MHKLNLVVVILGALCAGAAHAQDAAPSQASRSDLLQVVVRDDPRPALADRLVRLTLRGMDKFTQETITQQLETAGDAMPEDQRRWLRRNAAPIVETNLRPMIAAITQEYAGRFSEAELNALIAFYEGPMGQEIARKQMELGGALGETMQKFQIGFLTELMTKFCGEFDCEGQEVKGAPSAKAPRR